MNFNPAVFATSTLRERAVICRAFAAEARELAADAGEETREGYAELARAWSAIAAETEKLIVANQAT